MAGFTGVSYPFRLTPDYTGGIVTSTTGPTSAEHIEESIYQIVMTLIGEYWMRPRFGTQLPEAVGSPNTDIFAAQMETTIREQLILEEDRVQIKEVSVVSIPKEGLMLVTVNYRVTQTLVEGSLPVQISLGS